MSTVECSISCVCVFICRTELAALSTTGLIAQIRKLYDEAYNQGVQEAKEMSRGRHLNIFSLPPGPNKKPKKEQQ